MAKSVCGGPMCVHQMVKLRFYLLMTAIVWQYRANESVRAHQTISCCEKEYRITKWTSICTQAHPHFLWLTIRLERTKWLETVNSEHWTIITESKERQRIIINNGWILSEAQRDIHVDKHTVWVCVLVWSACACFQYLATVTNAPDLMAFNRHRKKAPPKMNVFCVHWLVGTGLSTRFYLHCESVY